MLTRFLKSAVISLVNTARFRKPVEISLLSWVRWLFPRFSRTSVYCSLLSTWSGNTTSHNQKQENPVTFLQITKETRNQYKTVFGVHFSSVMLHISMRNRIFNENKCRVSLDFIHQELTGLWKASIVQSEILSEYVLHLLSNIVKYY